MTADRVLDRLAKLKASRDGEARLGNSAAAEAFAEAINRLLIQHELSEVDIPLTVDDPIVELLVNLESYGVARSRVRIGWQEALARIVASAHLCRFLVTRGSNRITFVGTKTHATIAEHAYGVLTAAAARMSAEAREEWWRTVCGGRYLESGNFRAAWLGGFTERISERFDEARRTEVRAAAVAGMSTSMALVRLDNALVRVNAYMDDTYKQKKIPGARIGYGCREGREAGRLAADRVKLGQRGVKEGPVTKELRAAREGATRIVAQWIDQEGDLKTREARTLDEARELADRVLEACASAYGAVQIRRQTHRFGEWNDVALVEEVL